MVAMLNHVIRTSDHLQEIELKFLESGHTDMEVDSMHSAIKHEKKGRTIYSPTTIAFNYGYSDEEEQYFAQRRSANAGTMKQLFKSPIKLATEKVKDLQDLCRKGVIPDEYQEFYLNLNSNENVRDALVEPDVEEVSEEEEEV